MSERVDTIRERLNAATPGPWRFDGGYGIWRGNDDALLCHMHPATWERNDADEVNNPDAVFIANAPQDIAFLLDAFGQVEAERDALRARDVEAVRWLEAAEVAVRTLWPLTPMQSHRLAGQHEDVADFIEQACGTTARRYPMLPLSSAADSGTPPAPVSDTGEET